MQTSRGIGLPLFAVLVASHAAAAAPVSFEGRAVTLIVPYATGGGTDSAGRLVAEYFAKLLPGNPTVIVRNKPGADGKVGMNHFVHQVKPDGFTLAVGTGTSSDPLHYRKPQARFDPTEFVFIGGMGRGGYVLLIDKKAEPRLYDKRAAPVTMGTLSGLPRAAMGGTVWGVEFLGWNVRWVQGYRGTAELVLALERGEIDMTATGVTQQIRRLLDTGRISILTSFDSAGVVRSEFGDVPVFAKALKDKIADPTTLKAFQYYQSMMSVDKWIALPPGAPERIADVYRKAFAQMTEDPEFIERGRKMSEDFFPMPHQQVEKLIASLGSTPPEAIKFVDTLHKKQGLLPE